MRYIGREEEETSEEIRARALRGCARRGSAERKRFSPEVCPYFEGISKSKFGPFLFPVVVGFLEKKKRQQGHNHLR